MNLVLLFRFVWCGLGVRNGCAHLVEPHIDTITLNEQMVNLSA